MAGFSRFDRAGRHRLLAGLAALCLLLGAPAVAQTAKGEFPAGELEFVVPAKWNVEGGRQKVILVSPGEDAFVEFTLLQPGNENALKAQLGQRLTATLTDTVLSDDGQSTRINGMPAVKVTGIGSSDATAVRFVALALAPTPKQPVMVLAYTAQDGFPDLQPVFETLFASFNRR